MHIFHHWSEWAIYQRYYYSVLADRGWTWSAERRECSKCGKRQVRDI